MKVLITGASSGIGYSFARELSERGYDLILVSRDQYKLEILKDQLKTNVEIMSVDLSLASNCIELYNKVKNENIDILINNAGFGYCAPFENIELNKELNMIDLNIRAVHILTKLFIKDFKNRNSGYLLNVSSMAAFLPGPLMATYYATKSYVLRLTQALYEELRASSSSVYVGCLCPGPVNTNFNKVANVEFSANGLESQFVAHYAIKKMFQRKLIIIPGIKMKILFILDHIIPTKILMRFAYRFQKGKLS